MGMIHAKKREFSNAIRDYTRAIERSPSYTYAYMNRGLAYMNLGRWDQAESDFNAVLRFDPKNESAKQRRATCRAQRGQQSGFVAYGY